MEQPVLINVKLSIKEMQNQAEGVPAVSFVSKLLKSTLHKAVCYFLYIYTVSRFYLWEFINLVLFSLHVGLLSSTF